MAQQQPNAFLDKVKQASQRFSSVVMDTGAKTMLKVSSRSSFVLGSLAVHVAALLCLWRRCAGGTYLGQLFFAEILYPLHHTHALCVLSD